MTTFLWGNHPTEHRENTGPSFTLAYPVTEEKEFYQHDVWRSRNVGDLSPGGNKIFVNHKEQFLVIYKTRVKIKISIEIDASFTIGKIRKTSLDNFNKHCIKVRI